VACNVEETMQTSRTASKQRVLYVRRCTSIAVKSRTVHSRLRPGPDQCRSWNLGSDPSSESEPDSDSGHRLGVGPGCMALFLQWLIYRQPACQYNMQLRHGGTDHVIPRCPNKYMVIV